MCHNYMFYIVTDETTKLTYIVVMNLTKPSMDSLTIVI
jgi:hypothetical protein